MAKEVYMPALGMNQETGTLLRWLVDEGEEVRKGQPLMEIATDKTDVEIEAPATGRLSNVMATEGDEVPVGEVIAYIAAEGEVVSPRGPSADRAGEDHSAGGGADTSASIAERVTAVSPVAARIASEHGIDLLDVQPAGERIQKDDVLAYLSAQQQSTPARVLASPKARRLALEQGVVLNAIPGSGPDGAVLAADVLHFEQKTVDGADAQPYKDVSSIEEAAETVIPMSRMWQVMAERLTQSWNTIPQFSLEREVDARQLIAWRARAQQDSVVKITFTDLLVRVTAFALAQHPRLNAAWHEGEIRLNRRVHIGIAVAVEDGLLVPVIRNAGRAGLYELANTRADLVERTQGNMLMPEDLRDGTFTISNLGMFGVDRFRAIVNPPQAAILAVGAVTEKVVAEEGQLFARPTLALTLSCDHRIVDGARAAQFLNTLAAVIEEPLRMLA